MPASISGRHAASAALDESPEMSTATESKRPPLCPTDHDHEVIHSTNAPKKKIDRQSWDYIVRSGLAGGLAGCAAKTTVGPLDRVKILFQASSPQFQKYTGSWFGVVKAMRDIWGTDGLRGLFRGHSATLLRIFPYAGIKYLAYEQVRTIVISDPSKETTVRRFASGSLAGLISVFFTYPLEVIRVRMAFETKAHARTSLVDICQQIYHEQPPTIRTPKSIDTSSLSSAAATSISATSGAISRATPRSGLTNFFRGFTPTLWGMIPYAGGSFLAHDSAGDFMRHPRIVAYTALPASQQSANRDPTKPVPLRYWAELLTGGFAGFAGQTLSYPLEVVRRRMQVGGVVGDGHRLGMMEVANNIYRQTGFKGFFVGLTIGYIKVIPMVAVSFYVYERGKLALGI